MKILNRTKNIIDAKIKKYEKCFQNPEEEYEAAIISMQSTILDLEKSTAAALAEMTMTKKQIEEMEGEQAKWLENAKRAVGAGQDDLARKALIQKKSVTSEIEACQDFYRRSEENYKYFKQELTSSQEKYNSLKSKFDLLKHNKIMAKAGLSSRSNNEDEGKLEIEFDKLRNKNDLNQSVDKEFEELKEKLKAK